MAAWGKNNSHVRGKIALDVNDINDLRKLFDDKIKFDAPLSGYTSMGVGGPAEVLLIPTCSEDISNAIRWCSDKKVAWNIIGGGTNMIVKDSGIRGLVIAITKSLSGHSFEALDNEKRRVRVKAGTPLSLICTWAAEEGLSGLEFASGIPGSFGGAVKMNAGTNSGCMSDILESVKIVTPDGNELTVGVEELEASYRKMALKGVKSPGETCGSIITEASIILEVGDREEIKDRIRKSVELRKKSQPLGFRNSGCIFRNPENAPPAGKLIEMAGLKGAASGGAKISEIHANFIVNTGDAKAEDILRLMDLIKDEVRTKFSVNLEPEVLIAG